MNSTRKLAAQNWLWRMAGWLARWSLAIVGFAGVAVLLMVLSGVFTTKTPQSVPDSRRPVRPDGEIVAVELRSQPRFESAVGTIKPVHESAIAAKIMARVLEVRVSAGQSVQAGDLLVKLSDEDLQSRLKQSAAQLEAAQAHAQQAQADLVRAQQLYGSNAISRSEYETANTLVRTTTAEVTRATRAVEEAKVSLAYATLSAPFSGTVVDKRVEVGDTVAPGQTMLTLYDPGQMQLVANVRESLAMKLKIGQEVSAKLEALDLECTATVREIVPQADVGTRSFQVKVSGPCPPGIYSGMFGRILLPLEDESILLIPQRSVRYVGQLALVDVIDGDHLVRTHVQLGRTFGQMVEVLSGLRAGERLQLTVATDGSRR